MDKTSGLSFDDLVTLVFSQQDHVKVLEGEIIRLRQENDLLRQEVDRLRGGGRGGSSGPAPDAEPPPRTVPAFVKPSRKPRAKKARAKREHGYSRRQDAPTRFVDHYPNTCSCCGRQLASGGWIHDSRQVIDIPIVPVEVVEHRIMARHCGVCHRDEIARPDLSGAVVGKSRFGVRLMALVAHLSTTTRMTVRRIQDLLKSLYQLDISVGSISEILHKVAHMGASLYTQLRDELRASSYIHADETGSREDGLNGYIWSFSNDRTRAYVRDPSRGSKVVREFLGGFSGVLASDFYSAYHYYTGQHQYCWVHLLRDMRTLKETHPNSNMLSQWCQSVKDLYGEALRFGDQNRYKRADQRRRFEQRLLAIARPYTVGGLPQQYLASRICRRIKGLFTFVEHPEVPADNNAAERAIRPYVTRRKVSGGTRSRKGSDTLAVLLSLFATWKLREQPELEMCIQLLTRTPVTERP